MLKALFSVYSNCDILVAVCRQTAVSEELVKKVIIDPGCISCGACEFNAPDVFEVTDVSHIKKHVDVQNNEQHINKAIQGCPVGVIRWSNDEQS